MRRLSLLIGAVILFNNVLSAEHAWAACTSPAATAGAVEYTSGNYYYCNGTSWVDIAASPVSTLDESSMPTSGLVGHWKMDDGSGTTATDSSSNGNDGTLTNSPTWVTGQLSGAIDAAAGDEYIDVGDPAGGELDFGTGDFSVSFWIYLDGYVSQGSAANGLLGKKRLSSPNNTGYAFYIDSGNLPKFAVADGTSEALITATTDISGGWHHIIGLRNSGTVQLYIDGIKEGTDGSLSTDISNSNALTFLTDPSDLTGRNMDGKLDDIRIFNRALSTAEISCLAGQGCLDYELVGHWKLDETSGTTAVDSSGQGNDGTMGGGLAGGDTTVGKITTALSFDGVGDYIATNYNPPVQGSWSIAAWFKSDSTRTGFHTIFGSQYGSSGSEMRIYYDPSTGYMNVGLGDHNSGGLDWTCGNTGLFDGRWHHVVVAATHLSNLYCYIDGAIELTADISTSSQVTDTLDFPAYDIGAFYKNSVHQNFFEGVIDDVRTWERELSKHDIEELFCSGVPGRIDYNTTDEVLQFCNSAGMYNIGPTPGTGGAGCAATGTIAAGDAGTWQYDTTNSKMVYCDGTNWRNMGE